MKQVESSCFNKSVASKKKKLNAILFDFFIHLVLFVIFFGGLFLPLDGIMPLTAIPKNEYLNQRTELLKFVENTRIQSYDSKTDNLVDVETDYKEFAKSLVKTTYFYENEQYSEFNESGNTVIKTLTKEDTLTMDNVNFSNDNLAYYFLKYKKEHSIGTTTNYFSNFYTNALDIKNSKYSGYLHQDFNNKDINQGYINDCAILSKDAAIKLHSYLILNTVSSDGRAIYKLFLEMYKNAVSNGIKDIETNSDVYKNLISVFEKHYIDYSKNKIILLVLSYILAFILYYILLPIALRNGQTLGMKLFHIQYERSNGKKPNFVNYLIRYSVLFFTNAFQLLIAPTILGQFSLLTLSLIGSFRLIYLIMVFVALSIASLIVFYVSKDHVFLNEYCASLIYKDLDSLDIKKIIEERNNSIKN